MLRILCCLALVVSPVQTWPASAMVCGSVQIGALVVLETGLLLPASLARLPTAWLSGEWRAVLAAIHAQAHQPALGSRHGQGRRKRRRIRWVRRRSRRLPSVVAWRQLKPVLEESIQEASSSVETEAEPGGVTGFRLPVQIVVVTPDYNQTLPVLARVHHLRRADQVQALLLHPPPGHQPGPAHYLAGLPRSAPVP